MISDDPDPATLGFGIRCDTELAAQIATGVATPAAAAAGLFQNRTTGLLSNVQRQVLADRLAAQQPAASAVEVIAACADLGDRDQVAVWAREVLPGVDQATAVSVAKKLFAGGGGPAVLAALANPRVRFDQVLQIVAGSNRRDRDRFRQVAAPVIAHRLLAGDGARMGPVTGNQVAAVNAAARMLPAEKAEACQVAWSAGLQRAAVARRAAAGQTAEETVHGGWVRSGRGRAADVGEWGGADGVKARWERIGKSVRDTDEWAAEQIEVSHLAGWIGGGSTRRAARSRLADVAAGEIPVGGVR